LQLSHRFCNQKGYTSSCYPPTEGGDISKKQNKKPAARIVSLRRSLRRLGRDRRRLVKVALLAVVVILFTVTMAQRQFTSPEFQVDPAAYEPLLNTIAKGESRGNYNAHFGNATNKKIRFTEMPVGEVLQWQKDFVRKGSASSAVGKYQFIRPTLQGLVQQLGIDPRVRFDEKLQDKLAIKLLERRGAHAFVQKKLTREQFAANLAKEWAALPKIKGSNPSQSYYAGDGLNKARIKANEVYKALAALETYEPPVPI